VTVRLLSPILKYAIEQQVTDPDDFPEPEYFKKIY
jgi:hypothetical protein